MGKKKLKKLGNFTQNAPNGANQSATSFSQLKSSFENASKSKSRSKKITLSQDQNRTKNDLNIQSTECIVGNAGMQSDTKPKLQLTKKGGRIGRLRRIFEPGSPASPLREDHDLGPIENLCLESSTGKRKLSEIEEIFRVGKRTKGDV